MSDDAILNILISSGLSGEDETTQQLAYQIRQYIDKEIIGADEETPPFDHSVTSDGSTEVRNKLKATQRDKLREPMD